MHDEEGPRRLRQGADTPETLLRALTALRKGRDDSARLERVGQKMEVLASPQLPPSAAQLPARRGLFGQKLGAFKLLIAGLGLLAPLLFFQLMDDVTTVPSSDREGSPLPQNSEKVDPPQVTEVEAPAAEIGVAVAEQPAPSSKRVARSAFGAALRARKQRERSAPEAAPSEALAPTGSIEVSDQPRAEQPSSETVAEQPAAPAERPQPKPAATQEAPRVSEAELLLKARQALKRDPALALKLASEHQTQYANGRLTPEREVLAIEALRNLDRKQEADERLHKFEARYPGSIHLKRLHEAR